MVTNSGSVECKSEYCMKSTPEAAKPLAGAGFGPVVSPGRLRLHVHKLEWLAVVGAAQQGNNGL